FAVRREGRQPATECQARLARHAIPDVDPPFVIARRQQLAVWRKVDRLNGPTVVPRRLSFQFPAGYGPQSNGSVIATAAQGLPILAEGHGADAPLVPDGSLWRREPVQPFAGPAVPKANCALGATGGQLIVGCEDHRDERLGLVLDMEDLLACRQFPNANAGAD